MKALIDADVLLYECSSVAEPREAKGTEEAQPLKSFDFVKEVFDGRVADILKATKATSYTLYITGKGNFRFDIAVTQPYKGKRDEKKPYHYHNLMAYITGHENCRVIEGMEADDAMAVDQEIAWSCEEDDDYQIDPRFCETVICTRDKDLRMVPGWHYGWECGNQPEYRMTFIDPLGWIELSKDRKKIKGGGLKFFWSQMLTGDKVDHIPGLHGTGPVAAYDALNCCNTKEEMFTAVKSLYEMAFPDNWREYMLEQGRLLWMVRELDDGGNPVMWEIPDGGWKEI